MSPDTIPALFPTWTLPWFALAAVIAFLMRDLRLSLALAMVPLLRLVLIPTLWPVVAEFPVWALLILAVVIVIHTLHRLIVLVFGKQAAGHFTGSVLVSGAAWMLRTPFIVIYHLFSFPIHRITRRRNLRRMSS